MNTRSSFITIY